MILIKGSSTKKRMRQKLWNGNIMFCIWNKIRNNKISKILFKFRKTNYLQIKFRKFFMNNFNTFFVRNYIFWILNMLIISFKFLFKSNKFKQKNSNSQMSDLSCGKSFSLPCKIFISNLIWILYCQIYFWIHLSKQHHYFVPVTLPKGGRHSLSN